MLQLSSPYGASVRMIAHDCTMANLY